MIPETKYAFFTLTYDLIQQYREEGERYCMYSGDK